MVLKAYGGIIIPLTNSRFVVDAQPLMYTKLSKNCLPDLETVTERVTIILLRSDYYSGTTPGKRLFNKLTSSTT